MPECETPTLTSSAPRACRFTDASKLYQSSSHVSSIARPSHVAQPSDDVLPLLQEDLAPLRSILMTLGLGAGFRSEGDAQVRLIHAPSVVDLGSDASHLTHLE